MLAESLQGGGVIARYVAVASGLPPSPAWPTTATARPGCRRVQIARPVRSGPGMDQVVVAGGTESLSTMVLGQQVGAGVGAGPAAVDVAEPPRDARGARPSTWR